MTQHHTENHTENCHYCQYIKQTLHAEVCDCGHPWHSGLCDVPDQRYKGGMVAIGPCPCEESEMMSREKMERQQISQAEEVARAAYDAAMDAKYQARRDGEL